MIWLLLLASLVAILIAAEIFTNALEHLGEQLRISEGVTGSLFAAVGTALPETLVPVLALVAGTGDPTLNQEIGVGAIFGAPLMLSTLVISITGWSCSGSAVRAGFSSRSRRGCAGISMCSWAHSDWRRWAC